MADYPLRCYDCKMTFKSPSLLHKHRQKFCVGGKIGDPHDLTLRKGLWSEQGYYYDNQRISPELRPVSDGRLIEDKVRELGEYQSRKAEFRELRDQHEKAMLRKLNNLEKKTANQASYSSLESRSPFSDREFRILQLEYDKLRDEEQTILRQLADDHPKRQMITENNLTNLTSVMGSSSSRTGYDYSPRTDPRRDAQIWNIAESHGRNMANLSARNDELEKQKEDIRRRLNELGSRQDGRESTTRLLETLREQEIRNQRTLDELKNQLGNIDELEQLSKTINERITKLQEIKEARKSDGTVTSTGTTDQFPDPHSFSAGVLSVTSCRVEDDSPGAMQNAIGEDKHDRNLEKCENIERAIGAVEVKRRVTREQHISNEKYHTRQNCANPGANKKTLDKVSSSTMTMSSECLLSELRGLNQSVSTDLEPVLDNNNVWLKCLDILRRTLDYRESSEPRIALPRGYRYDRQGTLGAYQQEKGKRRTVPYPLYHSNGNNLVAEVSALRQNYLQSGGNDPAVLAQMADLIAEARLLEDRHRTDKHKPKTESSPQIQALELENARLQRELLLLQEQNLTARRRRKHNEEDDLERELQRLEKDHRGKMSELQHEIDTLRQQGELERYKRELAEDAARRSLSIPPPNPEQVPSVTRHADVPYIVQSHYGGSHPQIDPLAPAPYDPHYGFVIFYDFILGLDPRASTCRLVVGMYSALSSVGDPTVLPTVYTEQTNSSLKYTFSHSGVVIGAKQPVPRCAPNQDLSIMVELQLSGSPSSHHDVTRLVSRAWTKMDVFDDYGRLLSGRFRCPFRVIPIKPYINISDLNNIPQFGEAELFYRVINFRDVETQSGLPVTVTNANTYRYPPMALRSNSQHVNSAPLPPPPPSATPPISPPGSPRRSEVSSVRESPPVGELGPENTLGFQVDRVKAAESGEAKVRLTAYHASSGKVVQSSAGPMTCSTTSVRSNFKHSYHVFGQQEAIFQDIDIEGDMVVIVRFYLKKRLPDRNSDNNPDLQDPLSYDEEVLVAWAAIPLVRSLRSDKLTARSRRVYDPSYTRINVGTHRLRLYRPPVPEANQVPLDEQYQPKDWVRYRKATVRFHIFQGTPRPGSLTPSEASDDGENNLPENAWIALDRKVPPSEPYTSGDGFDLYIDGCRFLPDSVTFSRVAGRIMDRTYEVYGQDIVTGVKLDSDIYNPVYEHREEIRDPNIPPTATLLIKVYTVDNLFKQLTCVGNAAINVFVESGTDRQPTADTGVQVSLNEGAHQIRLYQRGPNGVDPVFESCLRDNQTRYLPCASILVRLVKVARGKNGKPLESSKVPQSDWVRLGLWQPRPDYSDKVYYSRQCTPTQGEGKMLHMMTKRPITTMREAVSKMAQAKESFLKSDKNLEQFIRNQLTRVMDTKPLDQDLNVVCVYSPKHGLKVAVDGACNLPWSNFTLASMCLNPPGAYYMGPPHATYDKLTFTGQLDLTSTNSSPTWRDGFKDFLSRSYHRFLTLIIHLQEVGVTLTDNNYKYGLLEQAWTAVQVFRDKYAYSMVFQLPLYLGSPTPEMLNQLSKEPCKEWFEANLRSHKVKLVEGSSVFVRLCDGRRDEELPQEVTSKTTIEVNREYIPSHLEEEYSETKEGKKLETLLPVGKTTHNFADSLGVKFKSLVYKLYEESNNDKKS